MKVILLFTRQVFFTVAILGLSACSACSLAVGSERPCQLTLMSWNVQTLFDANDVGTEYQDFRATAGWTETKYRARLEAIGSALTSVFPDGPDILALQEIEGQTVLKDLAEGPLAGFGYGWAAWARESGSALAVGLLSRLPLKSVLTHAVVIDGLEAARPILEVTIGDPEPLTFLVCHWKSKLSGAEATEVFRLAQARVVARRLQALKTQPVIVVGDLNENDDEFFRAGGQLLTALLPDDEQAAELIRATIAAEIADSLSEAEDSLTQPADCLVLSSERPPLAKHITDAMIVYSPWQASIWEGSYYYKGAWERIDHLLLTNSLFDGKGWEYCSFKVIDSAPFIDQAGKPAAYNPRLNYGLSDHLPLVAVFEYLK